MASAETLCLRLRQGLYPLRHPTKLQKQAPFTPLNKISFFAAAFRLVLTKCFLFYFKIVEAGFAREIP